MGTDRSFLALLALLYAIAAALFATRTPPWQVPDEPAHYNYIRFLATQGRLPVLQPGDYDQEYLSRIVSRGFPSDLPIDPLRYEFHQPPLYYLLAVPLFRWFHGALLPLRLFSAALGLAQALLAFAAVRRLFPERPGWARGVAVFLAFLPQHLAMNSGVNNDALAEAILMGLWVLLAAERNGHRAARGWIGGALLGLGFLTKTTIYPMAVVVLLGVLAWAAQEGAPSSERLRRLARWLGPALLLGGLWWGRNLITYGWPDALGLRQHDRVVVGQPRTTEWIARYGLGATLERFRVFTFQSFWGQFGWMGVVLDARLYFLFAWLTALGLLGLGLHLGRARRGSPLWGMRGLLLLLNAGLTAGAYIGYNLSFVQHQGRYLFPALLPIALGFTAGLQAWLEGPAARGLMGACGLGIAGFAMAGALSGDLPRFPMAVLGGTAMAAYGIRRFPALRPWLAPAGLLLAFALDLYLALGVLPRAFP